MKNIITIAILLFLSSCASFQQHKIPTVTFQNDVEQKVRDVAYYDISITGPYNNEVLVIYGEMQRRIKSKFDDSKRFSNSYLSSQNKGLYFKFSYVNHASITKAILAGVVNGATLTLFPVFVTDPWVLNVKVYDNGILKKEYKYNDEIRTWFHLTMLFVAPFKPVSEESYIMLTNMAAQSILDYEQDFGVSPKDNI